jgi:hypothetical protein
MNHINHDLISNFLLQVSETMPYGLCKTELNLEVGIAVYMSLDSSDMEISPGQEKIMTLFNTMYEGN